MTLRRVLRESRSSPVGGGGCTLSHPGQYMPRAQFLEAQGWPLGAGPVQHSRPWGPKRPRVGMERERPGGGGGGGREGDGDSTHISGEGEGEEVEEGRWRGVAGWTLEVLSLEGYTPAMEGEEGGEGEGQ